MRTFAEVLLNDTNKWLDGTNKGYQFCPPYDPYDTEGSREGSKNGRGRTPTQASLVFAQPLLSQRLLFRFFWACLHGVGAPPEGEVTRLGGLTLLSIYMFYLEHVNLI